MGLARLPEVEVRKCICQVMLIVKQLHDRRVCHGNISLDTIMTRQRRGGLEMNLSNFSNAVYFKQKKTAVPKVGKLGFSSLARLTKKASKDMVVVEMADDIKSLAKLTFELLSDIGSIVSASTLSED